MGFELIEKFLDSKWIQENVTEVQRLIVSLPTFSKQVDEGEFWLKDLSYNSDWEYDARIFLNQKDHLLIEVSSFSKAFFQDIKLLHEALRSNTPVTLMDDDGEEYQFK